MSLQIDLSRLVDIENEKFLKLKFLTERGSTFYFKMVFLKLFRINLIKVFVIFLKKVMKYCTE